MHMPMLWMPLPLPGGGGAEVPPVGAEGPATEGAAVPPPEGEAPIASPEYGESPGLSEGSGSYGFPGASTDGTYSGDSPVYVDESSPTGGDGEFMHDPWASPEQQEASEGGGFWGWVSDMSDTFGGGEE